MNSTKILVRAILIFLPALMLPLQLAAQAVPDHAKHHHYKLIDPGTFGGPRNYINSPDLLVPSISPGSAQNVNNRGVLTGWADTSTPDPYGPTYCFTFDCFVTHAFRSRGGSKTDLGVLPGGANSASTWISAKGLIVGTSQNGQLDPLFTGFPENQAVLWRGDEIISLGNLPEGGYENGAQAVNRRGQIVGWAFNTVPDPYSFAGAPGVNLYYSYEPYPYYYQERAFLWQDGVMQDLGTLGTGNDALPIAINEPGQVIGISYTTSTPNQTPSQCSAPGSTGVIPTVDPFLWENGHMLDLGTFGGTCGVPEWINDRGQVVGYSFLSGDQVAHAFQWTRATGMQDLGTLGGSSATASMINDSGQIVGGSSLANGNFHAFLWDGTLHDLGALNGCAYAWAINAHAQVVGNWGGSQCAQGAFLWENGGPMVDLNKLVLSTAGLYVAGAIEISDRGEIVGSACANDICYAMLLIPCDENHPNVEGCDYSLVDETEAAESRSLSDDAAPTASRSEADSKASSCNSSERASDLTPATGYRVHGACSIDSKNTLTGYCQGMVLFSHTCAGKLDTTQCPTGKSALEPKTESCGNFGVIEVDLKRSCEFLFE
jgi:probable HAF family extracellular repeat protein